jgi:hypothetical protein
MENLGYDPNFNIALNMPLDQLRFYCVNNDLFRRICMNQEFWLQRLQREYPKLIQYKPIDMTWAQYYNGLATDNIRIVYVAYEGQIIGAVLMFHDDVRYNVNDRVIDLLSSKNININNPKLILDLMSFATIPNSKFLDVLVYRTNFQTLPTDPFNPRPVTRFPNNNLWDSLKVININSGKKTIFYK